MEAIIIPYRGTVNDKSRLRSDLEETSVGKLLFHMTQNLINEVSQIESDVHLYILTKKNNLSFSGKFTVLYDKGDELNESLTSAFKEIKEDIITIVMADLPLIKSEEIKEIIYRHKIEKKILLGPTPDNGTSILTFNKNNSFPLVFGKNSALRFRDVFEKEALSYEILESKDVYRDIDKFKDLLEIMNIRQIIKECVDFE
jgi:2-phospho-L-lactate guanylyltransferase